MFNKGYDAMKVKKILKKITSVLLGVSTLAFGDTNTFASSGKTALGFVGSSYENPENKIPSLVILEAKKTIYYKLDDGLSSMLCSGFTIEQNGHNYFITAAHCIIEKIRDEWSLSSKNVKNNKSNLEKQESSSDQSKALLDFVSKQQWLVQLSQGISINNCKQYTALVEEKFDVESSKYCYSKSLAVPMKLQYIAGNALRWFVLDRLPPSAFNLVPFYDLAIFEFDPGFKIDKIAKLRLAEAEVEGELQYATGYPVGVPQILANEPGLPIFKPLGKDGLAISWGPKSLSDASVVLQGADGDAVLKALGVDKEFWAQSSNIFLSYTRPGMSGGPVLNSNGEVIGLITGTPRFSLDIDYNSMITVGPPLSIIKWAMSKLN